jgi:hypothetical protein
MYAYDSTYFYYCFANYTGNSAVWAQVTQVGNISLAEITSGSSNVTVVGPSANVAVGVNGTSNVAVFSSTGVYATGLISAVGNIRGSYILGDGSQLTGLPATYGDANVTTLLASFGNNVIVSTANITGENLLALGQVSAFGNITGGYILGNGSQLTGLPATYTNANVVALLFAFGGNSISTTGTITSGNITGSNVLTGGIVSSTGNISSQRNLLTQGIVSAVGNIVTDGYFVGTFVGNVTGNFVIPGSNTQVVFNTNGNADAVGGMTYNKGSNTFTVLGIVSSQGNVIAGNVTTTGQVSATGNVTGGNLIGTLATSSQTNITTVGTLGSLSVTANINGGNVRTSGQVSATGNITGGNVSATNITGSILSVTGTVLSTNVSATGNVTGGNLIGTLTTASQPGITTVGTLGSLSVTANINGGNLTTTGQVSATGNITGHNLTIGNVNAGSNISASNFTGITASVTGNVTGGNISTGGQISAVGNVTGNYILGNIAFASGLAASYGNSNVVTLLDNFGSNNISTTGNIAGGILTVNTITSGIVSATGNIDVIGNVNASFISTVNLLNTTNSTGANTGALQVAGGASINKDLWVTGNVYAGNITGTVANIITVQDPLLYLYSATTYPYTYDIGFYSHFTGGTGNTYQHTGLVRDFNDNTWKLFSNVAEPTFGVVTFNANTVYDALQVGSITAIGNVSATGNITSANLSVSTGTITVGNIVNANGNVVGNIGSSNNYFDTVFAKATSALYADLAEKYATDSDYTIGTVVVLGGEKEITVTTSHGDERVAGVISENPAYLMNSDCDGLAVALRGRVPVKVIGPVSKGDSLVTSPTPGMAASVGRSRDYAQAVFAKAIETDLTPGEKTIIAVIL